MSRQAIANIPVSKALKSGIITQLIDFTPQKKKKFKKRYLIDNIDKYPIVNSDKDFSGYMINLLSSRGNVTKSEAAKYLQSGGIDILRKAITHDSVDPIDPLNNYELLEHLGDSTVNKCTTWYLSRRFPDIVKKGKDAASYFTLQKNMLANKTFMAKFCDKIGLDKYILYRKLPYVNEKEQGKAAEPKYTEIDISVKEDVFEALFAAIETMIDNAEQMIGIGYAICYKIIASIYDDEYIPFTKNELKDNKTKLKEIFDKRRDDNYRYNYNEEKKEVWLDIYMKDKPPARAGPISTVIEKGVSDDTSKMEAEQLVAAAALDWLKKEYGIVRFPEEEK